MIKAWFKTPQAVLFLAAAVIILNAGFVTFASGIIAFDRGFFIDASCNEVSQVCLYTVTCDRAFGRDRPVFVSTELEEVMDVAASFRGRK